MAWLAATPSAAAKAYESAPACATIADAQAGKACRYTTAATVTAINRSTNATYVNLELPAYGPFLSAEMPPNPADGSRTNWDVVVGGPAQVELWKNQVTRLDGAPTVANPENDSFQGTMRSLAFLLAALGLGFIAWALLRARARRRDNQGGTGTRAGLGPIAVADGLWGR